MNQAEEKVIRAAIKRLGADANAAPEIKAMLADRRLQLYLGSWVVGMLECLLPENRDLKLAASLARD